MNKRVNSYQATAALVRAFFEAFGMGIIDSKICGDDFNQKNNPKIIKQIIVEHYEEISKYFFDIMFTSFVRLNYADIRKAQDDLQKQMADRQPDFFDYFKFACKTGKLYEAMISEYKRNFNMLLNGMFTTIPEHLENYVHGMMLSAVDEPLAINIMVRTIMKAYAAGLKAANENKKSFHQITLYRLFIININLLVNDSQLSESGHELLDLFKEACGNKEENLNVLFNTMDETMKELIDQDELLADNDEAN